VWTQAPIPARECSTRHAAQQPTPAAQAISSARDVGCTRADIPRGRSVATRVAIPMACRAR
jgi:hypothetical protein